MVGKKKRPISRSMRINEKTRVLVAEGIGMAKSSVNPKYEVNYEIDTEYTEKCELH